jgi:hypothetical protein
MSHDKISKFVLTNIYIDICQNYMNGYELEFESNYIFNSSIPDYTISNKNKFVHHKSNEYINFINELIDETITHKKKYVYKPAILIIFKLIQIFKNEFDDRLLWLYNNNLSKIKYFDQNNYFQAKTSELNNLGVYETVILNYVNGSTIYEMYEANIFIDDYFEFCWRLFYIDKSKTHLLLSEFEWIDGNVDLDDNKYNNLKFMLFLATLQQFMSINPSDRFDFSSIVNIKNPPDIKSIKFPIYMGLYVFFKISKSYIINNLKINFNKNDLMLNINKVFNLYVIMDIELFEKIFLYISKKESIDVINKYKYDIDEIFNSTSDFIKSQDDYILKNSVIRTNHNFNIINLESNDVLIDVFGGGNIHDDNEIKLPLNPYNKISYYVYWIKKNIEEFSDK